MMQTANALCILDSVRSELPGHTSAMNGRGLSPSACKSEQHSFVEEVKGLIFYVCVSLDFNVLLQRAYLYCSAGMHLTLLVGLQFYIHIFIVKVFPVFCRAIGDGQQAAGQQRLRRARGEGNRGPLCHSE